MKHTDKEFKEIIPLTAISKYTLEYLIQEVKKPPQQNL